MNKNTYNFLWGSVLLLMFASVALKAEYNIDYHVKKKIFKDDYEKALDRKGKPTIINEDVAPAVFVKTNKALFTVPKVTKYYGVTILPAESYEMPLPLNKDEWLHVSFTLHRFMTGNKSAASDSSLRFFITPAAQLAAGKVGPYMQKEALAIRVTNMVKNKRMLIELFQKIDGMKGIGQQLYLGHCSSANLPMTIQLFISKNQYMLQFSKRVVTSKGKLVGEQEFIKSMSGQYVGSLKAGVRLVNHDAGAKSQVVIDDFESNLVNVKKVSVKEAKVNRFDPKKDGNWNLVWQDEFEGDSLDKTKWETFVRLPEVIDHKTKLKFLMDEKNVALDGKGHLVITVDKNSDGNLVGGGIRSKYAKAFGYFEARLKLTKQPGWWAAFWLYRKTKSSNPLLGGLEFDILEDFWHKSRGNSSLQHAIHAGVGSLYRKSFTENVRVPKWEGWHTLSMKWEPLLTTFYVDGIETARFDATDVVSPKPCRMLLNAEASAGGFDGHPRDGEFPEEFIVDYVRVYERVVNRNNIPLVTLNNSEGKSLMEGDLVTVTADVEPRGSAIRKVYLFDNGYLIATKKQPPYIFDVEMSEDFFQKTPYHKSVNGKRIKSLFTDHVFSVWAEDENGEVGMSDTVKYYLDPKTVKSSSPYTGAPIVIPGRLEIEQFDKGGSGVAYLDSDDVNKSKNKAFRQDEKIAVDTDGQHLGHCQDSEWLVYTVDIKKSGNYTVLIPFSSGIEKGTWPFKGVNLEIDGKTVVTVPFPKGTADWATYKTVSAENVTLPAGRHLLKVRIIGGLFNLDYIEFKLEEGG